ncbi:arylamine N-acetyltransferase [Spirosoma daeguense]
MNIQAYLKRINYAGRPDMSLANLCALHCQHLLTVPLENLAIHAGIPIYLSLEALFEKIVTQGRGGICYELNGLFCELLRELGFTVHRVSGRTYIPGEIVNPEFDHLALIVHIDEQAYLVDVGLGRRFPIYPLRLSVNQIQEDRTGDYRITQLDTATFLLAQRTELGQWEKVYQFTLIPQKMSAFTDMCHYHQTSPDSFFTRNRVCTLVTEAGRITLSDRHLKGSINGQHIDQDIRSQQAFEKSLITYFGIYPYRNLN